MRFGFFMMPLHANRENPTLAFERDLQLIEYAESLGFDEFWVGSHNSGGWETIPARAGHLSCGRGHADHAHTAGDSGD